MLPTSILPGPGSYHLINLHELQILYNKLINISIFFKVYKESIRITDETA